MFTTSLDQSGQDFFWLGHNKNKTVVYDFYYTNA